ncbi:hypothetical protein KFU94_01690 [Chloroflexi bacterium TSY]|nr:hypothetical protein [Chloroflexi bacterium TSY]
MRSYLPNRTKAAVQAQRWLEKESTPTSEMVALRQLGLLLCKRILGNPSGPKCESLGAVNLPTTAAFVEMSRVEILELAQTISLSGTGPWQDQEARSRHFARTWGAVALSYARVGDLSVVAALVRAAAHLGLGDPWLVDAEEYLLDQQQADGSFGFLASELALLQDDATVPEALLRLTVEILWALAETAALTESSYIVPLTKSSLNS